MKILQLVIPDGTCSGCNYLKKQTIDHNYYGEQSSQLTCSIFSCNIDNCEPCAACKIIQTNDIDDVRKYADFLVREINRVPDEAYIKAIDDFAALIKPSVNHPAVIDDMAEHLKQKRLM